MKIQHQHARSGQAPPARPHLLLASSIACMMLFTLSLWPDGDHDAEANVPTSRLDAVIGPAIPRLEAASAPAVETPAEPDVQPEPEEIAPPDTWRTVEVRSGDSLARIFQRLDLDPAELHAIVTSGEPARRLRRIHPGDVLQYRTDADGGLLSLRYEFDRLEAFEAHRRVDGGGYDAELVEREPERRTAYRTATIDSSLFLAAAAAGLDDATAMQLADIFQWDIDFVLDIRAGDRFRVLQEELWLEGEKVADGPIVAAEFVNRGKLYRAVRYTASDGHTSYYTPEGRSMRKTFLRAPVEFSRISSNFNPRRRHPVKKTIMPHRGIDYAAPTGTPVQAAGDGRVVLVKSHYASGNYVVIEHGETYQTKYLHLSRFASGIRPGQRVDQGQVIGYVGATGWATGPHLHYEFLVHGVHQNPRTVELPKALPIAESERARFFATTGPTIAQLTELGSGERLAMSEQAASAPGS